MSEHAPNTDDQKPRKTAPPSIREHPTPLGTRRNGTYTSRGRVRTHVPNHRNRASPHLTEAQIIAAVAAATHARTIGKPLNRFVTIHLERGELPGRAQEAIAAYLKPAAKWLGKRGVPLTYLWWLEHAVGTGLHVHMLLHVPPDLRDAFNLKARNAWLKAAGLVPHAGVIRTERVEPRGVGPAGPNKRQSQSYFNQLRGVLRYMGKGIDPDAKSSLHRHLPLAERPTAAAALGIKPEYCHPIYGRRISVSQNIGTAARKGYETARHRQNTGRVPSGLPDWLGGKGKVERATPSKIA